MAGMSAKMRELRWFVPVLFAALFFVNSLTLQRMVPFPGGFDELQHISYAASLQESGSLLPRFEKQNNLSQDDFRRWTDVPNHVGHPSPFYLLVALLLDRSLSPEQAVFVPRLASIFLLWIGVALTLATGLRHFEKDNRAALVFCFAVALCPKLGAISSQVTNDSLSFLGGALVYSGLSGSEKWGRWRLVFVAAGVAFAFWSKPNAALAVGVWLAGYLLIVRHLRPEFLLPVCFGAAVGFLPYIHILWSYGTLVPVAAEHLGTVRDYQLGDLGAYLPIFFLNLGYTWPVSQTGGPVTVALFWTIIACAVLAGGLAWRRKGEGDAAMAVAGPAAFVLVLPIHLWFAATSLGFSIPAASFRYYLPLWPPLAHAISFGVMAAPRPRHRILFAWAAFAALMAGWASP